MRVNDRGPFTGGRSLDLSRAAANALGLVQRGAGQVEMFLLQASSALPGIPAADSIERLFGTARCANPARAVTRHAARHLHPPRFCAVLLRTARAHRPPAVLARMFGGYGIASGGLTVALIADLGQGERLWLKANDASRGTFEAAGCARFIYLAKGVAKSMNYYSAPDEAMESPHAMAPWAQLALAACIVGACAEERSAVSALAGGQPQRRAAPSKARPPWGAGRYTQ